MHTPALEYLSLRGLGAPAVVIALASQGVFRGFKDTKTPLYASGKILSVLHFWWIWLVHFDMLGSRFSTALILLCIVFAVAGNLVNVVLDPILMFTLKLGVGGAAAATVVSEYETVTDIFSWYYCFH